MSQLTIQAAFTHMGIDTQKESMAFSITGDDEKRSVELVPMVREAVILSVEGIDTDISAEFIDYAKKGKATVIKFVLKGDRSRFNANEFYTKVRSTVTLTIKESQMSIEELDQEEEKGLQYKIDGSGVVSNVTDPNQQTIDDLEEGKKQAAASSEDEELELA